MDIVPEQENRHMQMEEFFDNLKSEDATKKDLIKNFLSIQYPCLNKEEQQLMAYVLTDYFFSLLPEDAKDKLNNTFFEGIREEGIMQEVRLKSGEFKQGVRKYFDRYDLPMGYQLVSLTKNPLGNMVFDFVISETITEKTQEFEQQKRTNWIIERFTNPLHKDESGVWMSKQGNHYNETLFRHLQQKYS